MKHLRLSLSFAVALALAASTLASAVSPLRPDQNADSAWTGSNVDTSLAVVQLKGDPISTYVKTRPAHGKKVDFNSNTVKSYRAQLSALRNDFKQWLQANAPKAKITGSWDLALNAVSVQLNGTSLTLLATATQVNRVEYEGVYHLLDDNDPDLSIIHAQQAWQQAGGAANAGRGVRIAIVDTGIDISHPCFSDAGYPSQTQLGDTHFTNNKVIVAKVFNNKAGSRGYTAEALQDHGTHVAGTAACDLDTSASVDGVVLPYAMSGVAPAALLGNYNIFPGDVLDSRSEDILNALETAYSDGMDVANLSLGGNAHGSQDLLTVAIDDLDQANMVVAVAAGNSGPGHFTVESPGSAARALTAGASSVPHFIGTPLTWNSNSSGLASGDFAMVSADLTAPFAVVTGAIGGLGDACASLPAGSLTGEIAVISRGTCTFSQKIRNAQAAGAVAAVVVNNVAGDPIAMGEDGTANQPTIPAYMASLADRAALAASDGASATISATLSYIATSNVDIMAGFSSQGPTDVDFRVKPDVVAPGVNVLSSIPHQFCAAPPCFAFFQGTSMATPHLAGSAAVLRGQHPSWDASDIRSAIVNSADEGVLKDSVTGASVVTDPNIIGAGRENLLSAADAVVALGPISTSFGSIPKNSGTTKSNQVTVRNLSGTAKIFSFSTEGGGSGVSYSVTPASITLAAGGSGSIAVSMIADKGAAPGDHPGMLRVQSSSTEVAHAVLFTFVK
jgi:minor extracellular serine protease Vpr